MTQPPLCIMRQTKRVTIEWSQFEKCASIFVGSPALIPRLVLPLEGGIRRGLTENQRLLILQSITAGIGGHTTPSTIPCFLSHSFLPKVETIFHSRNVCGAKHFVTFISCWQLYSDAPHGGRLGFGLCVSHDLLRSKLLPSGLHSICCRSRSEWAIAGVRCGVPPCCCPARDWTPKSAHHED